MRGTPGGVEGLAIVSARKGKSAARARVFGLRGTAMAIAAALVAIAPTHADAKLKKQKPAPAATQSQPAASEPAAQSAVPAPVPPADAATAGDTTIPKTTIPPSFPKTVDEAKAEAAAAAKPPLKWTDAEIADAKAHCDVVLKRIHAVAIAHEPIKEGACGAPAPVELISIGQKPEVTFDPPPIVRCDLAEALTTWLEKDLQPLAQRHLKSPIIRIETMSSYSCRNAYGRKKTKLSEHGLANAVDIRGFVTASAETAYVLEGWGTPEREIVARAAAEKEAADKAERTRLAAAKGAPEGAVTSATATTASGVAAPSTLLARSTLMEGLPKLAAAAPGAVPDRLGGPIVRPDKSAKLKSGNATFIAMHTGVDAESNPDPEVRAFLHEAHAAACRIFGTTLGPEANADHRNHLHVDMAPRAVTKICD
jgi:hypothetical protein